MAGVRVSHLTRRESQIMEILHRRGRATAEEVRSELPDAPGGSTVRKLLEILMERGHIGREYDGPRFVYFPTSEPEEASRTALEQLVETFFRGSRRAAVAALLDADKEPLSESDYRSLTQLLKQARERKGGKP